MSGEIPTDKELHQPKTFDFPSWLKFLIQYVLMPLVMLILGYQLSGLSQQKQAESQAELKRAEIVSKLTKELFNLRPIEVLPQVKIIMDIVDKDTGDTIKNSIVQHYENILTVDNKGKLKLSERKKQRV